MVNNEIPEKLLNREIRRMIEEVKGWEISMDKFSGTQAISKTFEFKNFKEAFKFLEKVTRNVESYGHHPDMHLIEGRKVVLTLYTHSIKGLSKWDFELAKLLNRLKTH